MWRYGCAMTAGRMAYVLQIRIAIGLRVRSPPRRNGAAIPLRTQKRPGLTHAGFCFRKNTPTPYGVLSVRTMEQWSHGWRKTQTDEGTAIFLTARSKLLPLVGE